MCTKTYLRKCRIWKSCLGRNLKLVPAFNRLATTLCSPLCSIFRSIYRPSITLPLQTDVPSFHPRRLLVKYLPHFSDGTVPNLCRHCNRKIKTVSHASPSSSSLPGHCLIRLWYSTVSDVIFLNIEVHCFSAWWRWGSLELFCIPVHFVEWQFHVHESEVLQIITWLLQLCIIGCPCSR